MFADLFSLFVDLYIFETYAKNSAFICTHVNPSPINHLIYYLSIYPSIYLSIYLSLSLSPSIYLPIIYLHVIFCLLGCLPSCLSVILEINMIKYSLFAQVSDRCLVSSVLYDMCTSFSAIKLAIHLSVQSVRMVFVQCLKMPQVSVLIRTTPWHSQPFSVMSNVCSG